MAYFLRYELPDGERDEQHERDQQQQRVDGLAAAAQLQASVKPNRPAPMARPPGRQLPKIIAARPM